MILHYPDKGQLYRLRCRGTINGFHTCAGHSFDYFVCSVILLILSLLRGFPGFFRSSVRGKRRSLGLGNNLTTVRSIRLQVFLLPGPTERTPKSSREMELLQAGLGRRTVSLPENACHPEVMLN